MAKQTEPRGGSWLVAEEFYERGDPAFVDELRQIADADRLGTFAAKWFADKRPSSRQLLLRYLELPFSTFRHEALLKRLFKLAEKAGDDELMARFLVGFDRTIRRIRRKKHHYDWSNRESWTTETIVMPARSVMPRDRKFFFFRDPKTGERMAAPTAEKHAALRLFSTATRKYLRRRAWRYFRQIGKAQPDRFAPAATEALLQYTDDDTPDGLALIDNWSLVHLLFHHSPAIVASSAGWKLADGKSLAELTPAPAFEALWKRSSPSLLKLLFNSKCRPVRQWAMQLLRRDHAEALANIPLRQLLALLSHDDPELAQFAVDSLANSKELSNLKPDEWLQLLETASPQTLDPLCNLIGKHLDAGSLTLEQLVALACSRPLPVAKLGFAWLQQRPIKTADECRLVARVARGDDEVLRPEMVRWLRNTVAAAIPFQSDFLLELLDSRHQDVRREGWAWFLAEPLAHQDISLWTKLLESPYDDIRFEMVQLLESRASPAANPQGNRDFAKPKAMLSLEERGRLDPATIRMLWATVLLNTTRGGRIKPRVVTQISNRLLRRPDEAPLLMPILSAAIRSIRGPEFRSGLAAVVQLVEQKPELEPLVRSQFPELKLGVLS